MDSVVGRIGLAVEPQIAEAPSWTAPVRTLIVLDPSGNRHGRVEWLASEVDQEFMDALNALCQSAMGARAIRYPASASP